MRLTNQQLNFHLLSLFFKMSEDPKRVFNQNSNMNLFLLPRESSTVQDLQTSLKLRVYSRTKRVGQQIEPQVPYKQCQESNPDSLNEDNILFENILGNNDADDDLNLPNCPEKGS